jgi:hypothetical protein
LHVEVPGGQAERTGDRMHVQMQRPRVDGEVLDARFLGRFPQRCRGKASVPVLAVAAELQPAPDPRVQREQHLGAVVRENHCRGGQVARYAGPRAGVRAGSQEPEESLAQRPLSETTGFPAGQRLHCIGVHSGMRDCGMRDCGMRDCGMRDCGMRDCGMRDCGMRNRGIGSGDIRGIDHREDYRSTNPSSGSRGGRGCSGCAG